MKQQLKTLVHKPKHVTVISLIIAVSIGVIGYIQINKKDLFQLSENTGGIITGSTTVHNLSLGFLSGGRIKSVNVKAGDVVHKGEELATLDAGNVLGAVTQAKAAYGKAKADYEKLINGATGTAVDVVKASLHTAQVNLSESTKQQDILVANAKRTLLNSSITAEPTSDTITDSAPIISGIYTKTTEGTITVQTYITGNGAYFSASGIVTGDGSISTKESKPIGDSGLSILFPTAPTANNSWTISIPNTKASNYLTNYNAYQSAVQTRSQAIASLQAVVDQATASLAAVVTAARPEDVSAAQAQVDAAYGAIQVAQSAYDATVIKAPYDGKVNTVSVAVGQIAVPNVSVIEFEVTPTN